MQAHLKKIRLCPRLAALFYGSFRGLSRKNLNFMRLKTGETDLKLIADDPILRCIERTGWPPWLLPHAAETDTEPGPEPGGEDEDG